LQCLKKEAEKRGIVDSITKEWLRTNKPDETEISFQSVGTSKESKDLESERNKKRIERLTPKKHNSPVVLSLDEMVGPFSLIPYRGKRRFEQSNPGRIPANYSKNDELRYEHVCLNVNQQQLAMRQYNHKRGVP
jgi:hypothetical protein